MAWANTSILDDAQIWHSNTIFGRNTSMTTVKRSPTLMQRQWCILTKTRVAVPSPHPNTFTDSYVASVVPSLTALKTMTWTTMLGPNPNIVPYIFLPLTPNLNETRYHGTPLFLVNPFLILHRPRQRSLSKCPTTSKTRPHRRRRDCRYHRWRYNPCTARAHLPVLLHEATQAAG